MNTTSVLGVPGMSSKIGALVATDCDDADDDAADERARQARHAAEHGGGERRDEVTSTVMMPGPKLPPSGTAISAASPPSRAASTHVKLDSRRTLIPTSSVAVGSWLAPRIARPRLVRVKNSPSSDGEHDERADQQQPLVGDLHAEHRRRGRRGRSALAIGLPWALPNQISMPMASSATPAVATSSVTRGRVEQRPHDEPLGQEAHQRRRRRARRGPRRQ